MKRFATCIILILSLMHTSLNADCCCVTYFQAPVQKPKKRVAPCGPKTIFLPRSQGSNMARRIAGWKQLIPNCDGLAHGNLSFTTEYTGSFDSDRISQYLFGSTCLNFAGSQVPDRNPEEDIIADYFGLPTTFQGQICFKPTIQNAIVDVDYYLGLDCWYPGLYWEFRFPLCISWWDLGLNCSEYNNNPVVQPFFPACYMSDEPAATLDSLSSALSGSRTFGDMNSPFDFGRFAFYKQHKVGVADIDFIVGWNYILKPQTHFAVYTQVIMPGGNSPKSRTIFEPIVGNGHNWELGGGFNGHHNFIQWQDGSLGIYFDGFITYRFKDNQIRMFDFTQNGFLSRYLLLKQLKTVPNTTPQQYAYAGFLLNAIDFATRDCRVGDVVHGDLAIKISGYLCGWGLDVGYNVYGKSIEKLEIINSIYPSDENNKRFGIKGTQGVCYREFNTITMEPTGVTGQLNATERNATITHPGTIDNPEAILLPPPLVPITWDSPTTQPLNIAQQSNQPILLTACDLNPNSAVVPAQLTHKFFAHIGYTQIGTPWEPQIGVGGEVEFDGKKELLSSLNQWGVWLRVNFCF